MSNVSTFIDLKILSTDLFQSLLLFVNTGGVSKSQTSARTMPRQNLKILLCRVLSCDPFYTAITRGIPLWY